MKTLSMIATGTDREFRGGCIEYSATYTREGRADIYLARSRFYDVGFRIFGGVR